MNKQIMYIVHHTQDCQDYNEHQLVTNEQQANDVFVSTSDDETPFEIYKDCPYVNLPADQAEEIANDKIDNHE